ncbi:hypothetical protein IG631_20215 [Alternaria alternata]|nr:hypothetical protein IG631_20215 [Alternaria alternata]
MAFTSFRNYSHTNPRLSVRNRPRYQGFAPDIHPSGKANPTYQIAIMACVVTTQVKCAKYQVLYQYYFSHILTDDRYTSLAITSPMLSNMCCSKDQSHAQPTEHHQQRPTVSYSAATSISGEPAPRMLHARVASQVDVAPRIRNLGGHRPISASGGVCLWRSTTQLKGKAWLARLACVCTWMNAVDEDAKMYGSIGGLDPMDATWVEGVRGTARLR